jgi:large subunit ribosomal protein L23
MSRVKTKRNRPEPAPKGPALKPHQVILRPMVTEKGLFYSQSNNQYTFEVNSLATKTEIKNAIETLFEVKVDKVMTQTRKGKPRRYKFKFGRTRACKKAIVRLDGDHRIDFF